MLMTANHAHTSMTPHVNRSSLNISNPFCFATARISYRTCRHRPKDRALDYTPLPARAPSAKQPSAAADAGKIVA